MSLRIYAKNADRRALPVERLRLPSRTVRISNDSGGQGISDRIRRQVTLLSRSSIKGQESLSLVQTGEAALGEARELLQRMGDLAVQGLRDDLSSSDRLNLQKEVDLLRDDLNRITKGTEFNTRKLLDGSQGALISSSSPAVKGIVTGALKEAVVDFGVSIGLLQAGTPELQRSRALFLKKPLSKLAEGSTELRDLEAFEGTGESLLENPRTLILHGNGRSTELQLDGRMTLGQLASALQGAMASPEGLGIAGSRVEAVSTVVTAIPGVGGYLEMASGAAGKDSQVTVLGDPELLKALGFEVVRPATEMVYSVAVRDRHGRLNLSQTQGNRISGMLEGIDLLFSSQPAQIAGTTGLEPGIRLTASESFVLSVQAAAKGVTVNIPQGNWSLAGLARSIQAQMDFAVNGAETLSGVTTAVVDGQIRISYDPPAGATSAGNTVAISSYAGTALNLAVGSYDGSLSTAMDPGRTILGFSRFFGNLTGIASGTAVTIKVGDGNGPVAEISVFSAVGTLGPGSRTQADLLPFHEWEQMVNDTFVVHSVMVRLHQVGGSLAFTSTRVGREHQSGKTAIESRVELSGLSLPFTARFGFEAASALSAEGRGDANFKLHAVNQAHQHRISSATGEVVKMGFADMGATALGIEKLNVTTINAAVEALERLGQAAERVSAEKAKYDTWEKRLAESLKKLRDSEESESSQSDLHDAVVAAEMIDFAKELIREKAGTAMAAQANVHSLSVFNLLRDPGRFEY